MSGLSPRRPRAKASRRRPVLPGRVAELLAAEIARGYAGEVRMTAATHGRLMQALRPHELALALALSGESEARPDGTVHLKVPRNIAFFDAHLPPSQHTVAVTYSPKSGRWTSEIAAGFAGFDRLCAHVWRVQGRSEGMAARNLLSLIGAAYLAFLAEGGAS